MPSNFILSIAQTIQRNVHRKPISYQGASFGTINFRVDSPETKKLFPS